MIPLRDSHPAGIFPFWVITIVVLNVFVFFLELTSPSLEVFLTQYALIPSLVDFERWQTLTPFLTSQFLHAGFFHIGSNMLFLWVFGDNIEGKFGFLFFPLFYLLGGIAGGLLQYIFIPSSTIPMLGASGAVSGILGAYFALFPHHRVKTLIPVFGIPAVVDIPAYTMLFYWFFTQLFAGFASIAVATSGGVAFFAHIGGFVFGFAVAKLARK